MPGGHREAGEDILETAKRELQEETGAIKFEIKPICVYSVTGKTKILPYFGKRKLDDIRTPDVIQWQNEIMKLKKDNVARKAGTMGKYKMSRLNVQKILYKNVQLICRF